MNEQLLEQVAKMLRAQLKGAGHLWWIGGYVYGQTSNGDVFVILYPAAEYLKEKVVRVYDRDLKKLPSFIPVEGVDAGDTEANPSKEQAAKKGIYHPCPAFEICTFDGRDTQMGKERRFGDVLRLSKAAREALGQRPGQAATVQGQAQRAPQPSQPPQPPQPPLPEEPEEPEERSTVEMEALPDYRRMAIDAKAAAEFDYAAYMVLRDENGYSDVERVGKTRESLAPEWRPSLATNGALLAALEVYRVKRREAEGRGEATAAAHQFAKREARNRYAREMGE